MEVLSEKLFGEIQRELGALESIADLFPLVPKGIVENLSFIERLQVCVHGKHSQFCRYMPEIRMWLAEAVASEAEFSMASEHICGGDSAEALLFKRIAKIREAA